MEKHAIKRQLTFLIGVNATNVPFQMLASGETLVAVVDTADVIACVLNERCSVRVLKLRSENTRSPSKRRLG